LTDHHVKQDTDGVESNAAGRLHHANNIKYPMKFYYLFCSRKVLHNTSQTTYFTDLVYVHIPHCSEILKISFLLIKPLSCKEKLPHCHILAFTWTNPLRHIIIISNTLRNFSRSELVPYQLINKTRIPRAW